MRLLDTIRGWLHPDVISQYNEIASKLDGLQVHSKAYYRWKSRQPKGVFSSSFNTSPTYNDKCYIVAHKNEIIQLEKEIIEEEAFNSRRKAVITAASLYPHAFHAIVKKLSILPISDVNATLPGARISKHKAGMNKGNQSVEDPVTSTNRTISSLAKEEYDILYPKCHLSDLRKEEEVIVGELAREDLILKFEDEVLGDAYRSKYYQEFLESAHTSIDERIYCASHIDELDSFIDKIVDREYDELAEQYPIGLNYYKANYWPEATKKDVLEEKNEIAKLNEAVPKYNQLKRKYPNGLPAYEKYSSWDDGKNYAGPTIYEIIECEEEIKQFEKNAKEVAFYYNWQSTQKDFNDLCRNLVDKVLPKWGAIDYFIPFTKMQIDGTKSTGTFQVWQLFLNGYCDSKEVDTSYYPFYHKNKTDIPGFLNNELFYKKQVYDKLLALIDELVLRYSEKDEIQVLFANSGVDNAKDLNDFHFKYFKEQLDKRGVKHALLNPQPAIIWDRVRYLVVELISTNERLKSNCETILNIKRECHNACGKQGRFKCFTNILYISLCKGYDKSEMEELNRKKIEELEKKRREEERRLQEERERQQIEQKRQETVRKAREIASTYREAFEKYYPKCQSYSIDYDRAVEIIESESKIRDYQVFHERVKNAVSDWGKLQGIPFYFFYYYYPTRFTDISLESQKARSLIYRFKDGVANNTVYEMLKSKLSSTFASYDLRDMTFVCIPASTRQSNKDRYSSFSERLCNALGMRNAFNYIEITREKYQSHLGGTGTAEYNFDQDFFKDANIILFDDVVTRGRSMLQFKSQLEGLGAKVVCAISIGRTYSDYFGDNRQPHPWTGVL